MNTESQKKRLFVLGAGFSKPARMPDARELTDLLLDAGFLLDNEDFRAWIERMRRQIAHLENGDTRNQGFVPNIEQLFDLAQFDRELWLMEQHECTVGRNYGETPHTRAEAIAAWLDHMEMGLVGVLLDKQAEANQAIIGHFVEQLRRGDTVLTFNYDTLLENCLTVAERSWTHGFNAEPPADVTVLKLHGSLDWWLTHRDRTIKEAMSLFEKADQNIDWQNASADEKKAFDWEYNYILQRVDGLKESRVLNNAYTGLDKGHPRFPGLGGLGAHKPLHRLVGSGVVWRKAFVALSKADQIYVVGWSCSPYDIMARFHFSARMRMRQQAPSRTIVIDPNADRIRDNLAPVFGELKLVNEHSEDVDWGQLVR